MHAVSSQLRRTYHSLIRGKGLQETTLHHTYAAAVNGCVV